MHPLEVVPTVINRVIYMLAGVAIYLIVVQSEAIRPLWAMNLKTPTSLDQDYLETLIQDAERAQQKAAGQLKK